MFQEAFSQMLVKQMDPMNSVMQTMASNMVESQSDQLITAKAKAIADVESFLENAKTNGSSQTVIDAYERLLKRISS